MASLKKLPASKSTSNRKASLPQQLQAFLADFFSNSNLVNPKLTVAFSGGLDSCVLLHLLYQTKKIIPFQLTAHHVHHGLSPNADVWSSFCKDVCKNLNIPLIITKIQIKNSGLGLEAAAREARYKVLLEGTVQLKDKAQLTDRVQLVDKVQLIDKVQSEADADFTSPDFILLAHHQDDQAETFLLQLARGAGVKGLAGMAIENGKLLRPLLDVPRKALENYAKQYRLTWVEDESNADSRFDRNFIRHAVLPVLQNQYPAIKQNISRSAQHMAEANALLDEIAALDTNACVVGGQLNLQSLQQLSLPRIHNTLRYWLVQQNCNLPSTAQLQQMVQQLLHAKADASVKIKVSSHLTLQRYRQYAFLLADTTPAPIINLLWQGEDVVQLPDGSRLMFTQLVGQGFAISRVPNIKLRIKNREGGERFRPDLGRPSRSLKTILQSCEIPPWQRAQLPLMFMDETLVMIPNIGVDANFKANTDEMGLVVRWIIK